MNLLGSTHLDSVSAARELALAHAINSSALVHCYKRLKTVPPTDGRTVRQSNRQTVVNKTPELEGPAARMLRIRHTVDCAQLKDTLFS